MDIWPGIFISPQPNQKKGRKRKSPRPQTQHSSNYPVLDYGTLASAVERKGTEGYEWVFPKSKTKGWLRPVGEPEKFFPNTRACKVLETRASINQRAEHGARFLRSYHPDVDLPFELIKDELREADIVTDSIRNFDPFSGNTICTVYCNEGQRKRNILVAFPTGVNGTDLNVSPIYFRTDNLQFTPRSSSAWSFETPIQHIVSTFPANRPGPERKKNNFMAVRTYGGTSIFDLQKQVTYGLAQAPPRLKELSVIHPSDIGGGGLLDMSFIPSSTPELFLVDSHGSLYKYSLKGERKFSHYLLDGNSEKSDDKFWSIRARNSSFEGIFCSSESIKSFDTRLGVATTKLYSADSALLTSMEDTGVDHLLCASTTREVVWIDDRYPRRPLLGARHHRNFDRTLSVQTVSLNQVTISLLQSKRNGYVSAFGVSPLESGPMQSCFNASALPFTGSTDSNQFSRTIVRHSGGGSFSLLEIDEQGSIRHIEMAYDQDDEETRRSQLVLNWSDEIKELDKISENLKPDYGRMGGRELVEVNLSDIYEKLFDIDEKRNREEADANTESVYDLIDRMPSFWRREETDSATSLTLFDVALNSNEVPLRQARADFLTGTPLNSVRGYRALRQGRLGLSSDNMKSLKDEAGWHFDLTSTLRSIDPDVLCDCTEWESYAPYSVRREEDIPEADRRESESAQQLALDLALSKDVLRSSPFKSTATSSNPSDEALELADTLSIATGKLSLNEHSQEPPPVVFGSCVPKQGKKKKKDMAHYKETHVYGDDEDAIDIDIDINDEEERPAKMPLGVRLLLNEWKVGTDPNEYTYTDPYDLEARHRDRPLLDPFIIMTPASMQQSQSQAPPTIVAAKKMTSTTQPPAIASSSQPPIKAHTFPKQLLTQASYSQIFGAQAESQVESQMEMASTQVLPGRFGGRPALSAKKKPPKKRIGGF